MEEYVRMSLFQQVLHGLLSLDSHPTFQRPTPTKGRICQSPPTPEASMSINILMAKLHIKRVI